MEPLHQPARVPGGAEGARSWSARSARSACPRSRSGTSSSSCSSTRPLENWERDILAIVREEAYYFAPQGMTKVLNEGWASYWHCDDHDPARAAPTPRSSTSPTTTRARWPCSPGRLNPYKIGIELFREIEDRWNKGKFGKEYDECDDLEAKRRWDRKLGLGPPEDLRGPEDLQRRHVHRRLHERGVLRAPASSSSTATTRAPGAT